MEERKTTPSAPASPPSGLHQVFLVLVPKAAAPLQRELWIGLALDTAVVLATTGLTLAGVVPPVVFVALVGPMIGACITVSRSSGVRALLLALLRLRGRGGT